MNKNAITRLITEFERLFPTWDQTKNEAGEYTAIATIVAFGLFKSGYVMGRMTRG